MATAESHTLAPAFEQFIERMPKIELHLHLEGSITPRALLDIARRNDVDLPARDEAGVAQLFDYRTFGEFLTVFMALAQALRYRQDFEQIAYDLGVHLTNQQVRYAEVMISAAQYYRRGIDLHEVVAGAAAGLARAQREFGLQWRLAFDYGRQLGVEMAWPILKSAIETMPLGVAAWSIGGDEVGNPPEPFAEVFAMARQAGLHTMAHAGEVVGPASVWGAVTALQVERIGHGIRSVDDVRLLEDLRERQVVLDVCPTSNVRTGAVASLGAHPLRELYDAGIPITINSDDPVFFATSITEELTIAARNFGFTADEWSESVLDSARASFLPVEEKASLLASMQREIRELRQVLGL